MNTVKEKVIENANKINEFLHNTKSPINTKINLALKNENILKIDLDSGKKQSNDEIGISFTHIGENKYF